MHRGFFWSDPRRQDDYHLYQEKKVNEDNIDYIMEKPSELSMQKSSFPG